MKDANSCDFSIDNVVITYQSDQVSTVCSGANDSYMFGFNGKEKLNEQYGEGNAYDFGARIYDPRLGNFLSTDPLYSDNCERSPYGYAANSPISLVDRDGKDDIYYISIVYKGKTYFKTVTLETTYQLAYSYNGLVHKIVSPNSNGQPDLPGYRWVNNAQDYQYDLIYNFTINVPDDIDIENLTEDDIVNMLGIAEETYAPFFQSKFDLSRYGFELYGSSGKGGDDYSRKGKTDGKGGLEGLIFPGGGADTKYRIKKILDIMKFFVDAGIEESKDKGTSIDTSTYKRVPIKRPDGTIVSENGKTTDKNVDYIETDDFGGTIQVDTNATDQPKEQ